MLLPSLLRQFDPQLPVAGLGDTEITGVCEDSRLVQRGYLFVARSGTRIEGARYLHDAMERGAVAAVVSSKVPEIALPQVIVKDVNRAASSLANLYFDRPSSRVRILGVTGTNGKTTSTYLLRHLLGTVGSRCGLIGTVEIDDGRNRREANMTTPSACDVAELLASMRDKGCRACAMEVSSHALDQSRVSGVEFAGAAFMNLTGDHLDYHLTMERYADAKAQLFESLPASAVAAVNCDDKWAQRMERDCRARVIRFGFGKSADYRARDIEVSSEGTRFLLAAPGGRSEIATSLVGRHNVQNLLAAAALAGEVFGLSLQQIAAAFRDAQGAPGRLQPVRAGQGFAVLVDYAHTDDALENVLQALRPLTRGKLRILFGCGGDRDRSKRPRMARIAEKLADAVYITSDNPRTEAPQAIIDEIAAGLTTGGRASAVIDVDRRNAIARVVSDAAADDVVLIAGKGHENYQIIGTEKHHFDDVEEATDALQALQIGRSAA